MYDPIVIYDDTVELALPIIDNGRLIKDKYGKAQTEIREVPAHVRYHLKNYYNERGEGITSEAQVYIPYSEITNRIDLNTRITHKDPSKQTFTRSTQKIEYGQDVMGKTKFIKVYL